MRAGADSIIITFLTPYVMLQAVFNTMRMLARWRLILRLKNAMVGAVFASKICGRATS